MEQQQQPSGHAEHGNEATSRLCVKNIPKYLNEQRLKDHFSAKGQVTDVKILKTRDGQSRQMAFVGYRTIEDATVAMKYFQNTYIDTSKLSIEFARRYRAPGAAADASAAAAAADKEHRPWSKYSTGSSKHQQLLAKQQQQQAAAADATDPKAAAKAARAAEKAAKAAKKAAKSAVDAAAAEDPKLAEFLQLMQRRSKAQIWSNDEVLPAGAAAVVAAAAANGTAAMAVDADDEADELYVDLPDLKQQQQQHKPAAAEDDSSDQESDEEDPSDPLAEKDVVVVDEGISDLDYLRSRMRSNLGQEQQQQGDDGSLASSSDEDDAADESASDLGSDHDDEHMQDAEQDLQQQQQQGADDAEPSSDLDREHHGEADQFNAAVRGNQDGVGTSASADSRSAAEAEILETGRLFVRNLSYAATEADLSELFGGFGTIEAVHLVLDRETKRSKGIAYVKFLLPEDAVAAYRSLDMSPFQGRLMHVLPAKKHPGDDAAAAAAQQQQHGTDADDGGSGVQPTSFKAQREMQRKGDAGNRSAWSSLFMRADTVAAAVAAHYGVSKAQLLDAAAADLPLRMALGEAQVIAQTKAALADGGINIASLESAAAASGKAAASKSVARSSTTLLVKNLPFSADEDELRQLFAGTGRSVVRLVVPPTKTLALVEFAEPQEARSAFKSLAYKKYQQVPLYLEWAPKDIWDASAPAAAAATKSKVSDQSDEAVSGSGTASKAGSGVAAADPGSSKVSDQAAATDGDQGQDEEDQPVACIYVKNLNFATTDSALKKHFDKAISAAGGRIHSAKVARRKGPDGKLLSMGFGFVETDSEASAKAAIKSLQASMLDKHKLQLQLSKHGAAGSATAAKASKAAAAAKAAAAKVAGTKLVVRNVAFEATRKDLLGLFGPFGHIKSCRLPKKFDGNHRGFAFLEFTTKQEAQNAFEGVGGTHLYGRRLVVEYAQADDEGAGLDELRAKTAAKFAGGDDEGMEEAPAPKRMKKNL